MNRGYVRAGLERAEPDRPLRFTAATEGRKGDGINLRMVGARLERFLANPVVGYAHDYWGREDLPIGRATSVEVDGDRLLIDVEFDPDDEFAQRVERKYRGGYLNAVSIGFDVREWESKGESVWRGGTAVDWELVELSAVPIGMDASAVVAAGRGLRDGFGQLVERMPADPSVRVERDRAAETRSVRVGEELIRRADPLLLSAAIGRALCAAPVDDAPAGPDAGEAAPGSEPAARSEAPAGDGPGGARLAEEVAALRVDIDALTCALTAAAAPAAARGAIASHDTAVVDTEWDGDAAVAEAPNDREVLRYMHAWADPDGDPDDKSTYKLPHHAPRVGAPANLPAVRNALARLSQTDMPDGDRAAVERHLRTHLEAQDDDGEEEGRGAAAEVARFTAADVERAFAGLAI